MRAQVHFRRDSSQGRLRRKNVEQTQERRRRIVRERRWDDLVWQRSEEDVVDSSKLFGGKIQFFGVNALPTSRIQPLYQCLQSNYRFCCCEAAMPSMMHIRLAQE